MPPVGKRRFTPRFEEVGGGNVGRAGGAGLIDVKAEADDLLDFGEETIETEFGRRVEGRVAAENEEGLDRALADLFGERPPSMEAALAVSELKM